MESLDLTRKIGCSSAATRVGLIRPLGDVPVFTPNLGNGPRGEIEDIEDFDDKLGLRTRGCDAGADGWFGDDVGILRVPTSEYLEVELGCRLVLLLTWWRRSGDGDLTGERDRGGTMCARAFSPPVCAMLFTLARITGGAEGGEGDPSTPSLTLRVLA